MIFSGGHALVKLLFLVILTILASAVAPDNNENCQGWAEMGECERVGLLCIICYISVGNGVKRDSERGKPSSDSSWIDTVLLLTFRFLSVSRLFFWSIIFILLLF